MQTTSARITELVLAELERGESRLLVLVVAVRKALGKSVVFKGDLSAAVKSALRKLVATNVVVDCEGTYRLALPAAPASTGGRPVAVK